MTISSTLVPSPALIMSLVEGILPLAYHRIMGIIQIDIKTRSVTKNSSRSVILEKCQNHSDQQKSPAKLTILFQQMPLQHGAAQD